MSVAATELLKKALSTEGRHSNLGGTAAMLGTTTAILQRAAQKGEVPPALPPEGIFRTGRYPPAQIALMRLSGIFARVSPGYPDTNIPTGRGMRPTEGSDLEKALRLEGSTVSDLICRHGRELLNGREREALSLRYGLDGVGVRSYAEIARELGMSSQRARTLVGEGRRRLAREERVAQEYREQMDALYAGPPGCRGELGRW